MKEAPVPPALSGRPLDGAVRTLFSFSWNQAREAVRTGKIAVDGVVITDGLKFVRTGQTVRWDEAARRPRPETDLPKEAVAFVDNHVVVVEKPSGISTIPFDEKETGTLDARVRSWLAAHDRNLRGARGAPPTLGIVHRIDKETSGLVVFTRSWQAKQSLANQFRFHTVHRRYLAIVHGHFKGGTITSHILDDRGDGLRGSWEARPRKSKSPQGQWARTHIEVVEELEGATLVACRLETGRTHQIRIHLAEAGHPLLGDRVYIRGFRGNEIPAPRLMLHAAELGFTHPAHEGDVRFERPVPPDFDETLNRLRK